MDRRKLTDEEIEDQRRGSTRIAPGIWVDREGGLHLSVPELLELFEVEDTPENRDLCVQTCLDVFCRQAPDAKIIVQD